MTTYTPGARQELVDEAHEFLKRYDLLPSPSEVLSAVDVVTVVAAAMFAERTKAKKRESGLLEALKEAKKIIRVFHGEAAWEIYDRASPEMKRINTAIAQAQEGK